MARTALRRLPTTRSLRRWTLGATALLPILVAHCVAAPTERPTESASKLPAAGHAATPPEASTEGTTELTSETLLTAVQTGRLPDAVRTYSALAHPSADDEYLVGHALMAWCRPDDAASHLDAAKAHGWSKWPGWPSVDSLLSRVAEVRRLAPPALDPPVDAAIEVHAGPPTAWSAPVLRAVPEFAAVGRRIFGADVPRERLYLFPDHATYERFYCALFGAEIFTAWQDGTGTTNVVVFCEQDSDGKATRLAGDPDTIGNVLHEFGHAWCETYVIDRYGRNWRTVALQHPWLREGIANVVASLREPELLQRRTAWLRTNAKSISAPTFADLTSEDRFYRSKDVYACYSLSTALVAELVGPLDAAPAKIRAILDAVGKTGDVEAAVLAATGKDVRKEFAKVVARFW